MRVLVTGAAGFIGSHVVESLLDAGHDALAYDALLPAVHPEPERSRDRIPADVEFVQADVRDPDALGRALRGVDAVCHQAAMVGLGLDLDDAPHYAGCNDLGTAVLLAAMARADVPRLALASSMVVYGEGRYDCAEHGRVEPGPRVVADLAAGRFEPPCPHCGRPLTPGMVDEDARVDPRNVYAATKAAQEYLATSWARATEGAVAMLRYHNVYGPRMPRDTPYAGVAAIFRSELRAGRPPRVFEDGGQRRDFVHVRDIAAANVAALEWTGKADPGAGRAFNVGSGTPRTVGELAAALASALGGPEPVVTGQYRLGDVRHVTASNRRLREELGWQPAVSFADGLAQFVVPA
ncbi:NAD-dependent epimerase/dehydratase family protein [Actinocrinis puniceicyclus]|uniref:NAD-dependent epimerase/dehydratase family protein n=1 Tax=Actinocrinis puniceicyclus TaxID=977794 RepID=A0A8J7WRM3_9ACTN|nr:NAD-dependent epimerase/dehydratase family protein [Actinocrinis puniceicyclus]MBS2964742.1 NAD-dependent epimerase/dehydratase family protein [Actinocrinis puniceicyclus]